MGRLLCLIEVARGFARLAVVEAEPVQESNQSRTAVAKSEVLLDPRPDHLGAARQPSRDPVLQRSLLSFRQAACATFRTEAAYAVQAIALEARYHPPPCHRPAAMPMRLWRNSSRHREEQSRSLAARCDVRQARRVPALPAPAALLTIKIQPESSIKTNRCSQPRQVLLGFTQSQGIAGNFRMETGSYVTASAATQSHVWRRFPGGWRLHQPVTLRQGGFHESGMRPYRRQI